MESHLRYGPKRDGKFILRGGDYLTHHARSVLPIHMGGESLVIPATLDDRTVTYLDKANAMSPAGFKGHSQPGRARVVPLHAHFDAEEGEDMAPPAHIGRNTGGGGGVNKVMSKLNLTQEPLGIFSYPYCSARQIPTKNTCRCHVFSVTIPFGSQ